MFKIEIVAIGKMSNGFYKAAEKEYIKRTTPYYEVSITEFPEQKEQGSGEKAVLKVVQLEGQRIIKYLEKTKHPVYALAIEGKAISSESFANILSNLTNTSSGCIFVIGGSYGLSEEVKKRADSLISLSSMTFPHQLARIVVLEQIYRSATINNGITYHK